MYTINIRGKMNPKDQQMVKLELIFFKTGYARVPKVLNVTGLLKNSAAKLLQKSEMRKDIVIELSYKGFS